MNKLFFNDVKFMIPVFFFFFWELGFISSYIEVETWKRSYLVTVLYNIKFSLFLTLFNR